MSWSVKSSFTKEHSLLGGRFFALTHPSIPYSSLIAETWAMGCSQGTLTNITNLTHLTNKDIDDLILFLNGLGSQGVGTAFVSKRYLFTVDKPSMEKAHMKYLISKSEKLAEYENLSHPSNGVILYMLTTKQGSR